MASTLPPLATTRTPAGAGTFADVLGEGVETDDDDAGAGGRGAQAASKTAESASDRVFRDTMLGHRPTSPKRDDEFVREPPRAAMAAVID